VSNDLNWGKHEPCCDKEREDAPVRAGQARDGLQRKSLEWERKGQRREENVR